uniref:Sec-independent protein translocase-like protein n=1 Tax=Gastroclonium compressum TaxID=1852973 RepID=A0A173G028_GASCM|nr:sec-independent protein translocase-like protein [Coeloseira compressa]ANH09629.1 sec-independent protein translocase-like protein [Coeloseira compressa]
MKKTIQNNKEMPLGDHLEELRTRITISIIIFATITIGCFLYVKNISLLIQQPANGIKFLQLAPGEYLFASIKLAIYTGFLFSSPFTIYQILIFILPGLTEKETSIIVPIISSSIILFFTGLTFAYKILAPAALQFLINYGSDIVEPTWSFEQYFDFMLLLFFSTGLSFQIPVIQITIGLLNLVSSNKMLKYWRYVIFFSTIISAILTPSTDPVTQGIMSLAICSLYISGIIVLKILNK